MTGKWTRRSLLRHGVAACTGALCFPAAIAADQGPMASSLRAAAKPAGKLLGMFSGQHELMTNPLAARTISSEFNMLSIGNDLKMNRIHPAPDSFNFSYGDWDLDWSKRNGLLFRGHTLVWHNALPEWFAGYVNQQNAGRVMIDHITTVVKHYSGQMFSWDVVNEPIHHDGRPDELRRKPWLDLVGPDYIDIAFRTAAAADPKAKLFLNECYIEHDLPLHKQRRDALLQLATRMKKDNVPITGLGIQGHVKAGVPLATSAMKDFLAELRDLNLQVMITEFDVDDTNIAAAEIDRAVARTYAEYLDLVGPFASVINFEQCADDVTLPKRPDNLPHRPNLFDNYYEKKPAYHAVADSLAAMRRPRL